MSRNDVTTQHRAVAMQIMEDPARRAALLEGLDPRSFDALEALAHSVMESYRYLPDYLDDPIEKAARRAKPSEFRYGARHYYGAKRDRARGFGELADREDLRHIQEGIAGLLGFSLWDLPLVDKPPEWLRMLGGMDDDRARMDAALAAWFTEVGAMLTLRAGQSDAGRAVQRLAATTMAEAGASGMPDVDRDAPLFSEGTLYELVGKEQARTVLARLRHVEQAVGVTS